MTGKERLAVGFFISLSLHYILLGGLAEPTAESASELMMIVDLNRPEAGVCVAAPMVLEQMADETRDPEEEAADRRRSALAHYLEGIKQAIHSKRMLTGGDGRRLVGNALFSLTVTGDGSFTSVRLLRGSGVDVLDADAMQAIHAAGGVVPRPACLGNMPLRIRVTVKYQFGL